MSKIRALKEILDTKSRRSKKPVKICVVTSEFIGPVKNGGIGAATTGLLETLRKDKHDISVLYTLVQNGIPDCVEQTWPHWQKVMKKKGIKLHHINNEQEYRSWRLKSWLVMEHIQKHDYDVVIFNEHHANGYYSIEAKRCGIEPFASQTHCVWTHGSLQWVFEINDQYVSRAADIELISMERRTVEQADIVLGPSRYILEKYRSYGWDLPEMTFHQPLPLLHNPNPAPDLSRKDVDELVFFGRLETRKGLWVFCDALDRLGDKLAGKRVTFLGRTTSESGFSSGSLLMARSQNWPFKLRMIKDYGQEKALEYLRGKGRLAVIPSLADNSPCVIYECMENSVPFISTRGSGIQELVDRRDWKKVLVEPNAIALAEKIGEVLDKGASLSRPAFDTRENLKYWSAFSYYLGERSKPAAKETASRERFDAAVFWVDSGGALSPLIRNLISNSARIGRSCPVGLITQRGPAIREMIGEIAGAGHAAIEIIDAADAKAIGKALARNRYAVFADSEIEITPRFFEGAATALREADVVSCVVADRASINDDMRISRLPCGNLSGLPYLGHAMGSGLWACSVKKAQDLLLKADFTDPETDRYVSATEIGQQLMLACGANDLAYQLMPIVGGVALMSRSADAAAEKPFSRIEKRAQIGKVEPTIRQGGPVWLAMCEFAAENSRVAATRDSTASVLAKSHPLSMIRAGQIDDTLINQAAALGRPDLALELAADEWLNDENGKSVIDLLTAAKKERLRINLLPRLSDAWWAGETEKRIGRASHRQGAISPRLQALLEERQAGETARPSRKKTQSANAVTPEKVDAFCRVGSMTITSSGPRIKSTRTGTGSIAFFDVPLAGHSALEIALRFDKETSGRFEFDIIDSKYGISIFSEEAKISKKDELHKRVDLDGLFVDVVVKISWKIEKDRQFDIDLLELA